jgi:hypothetical protein
VEVVVVVVREDTIKAGVPEGAILQDPGAMIRVIHHDHEEMIKVVEAMHQGQDVMIRELMVSEEKVMGTGMAGIGQEGAMMIKAGKEVGLRATATETVGRMVMLLIAIPEIEVIIARKEDLEDRVEMRMNN